MRPVQVLCLALLLSGFAAAQVVVVNGYATNQVPAYGITAVPFVPLVTTPSVSLDPVPTVIGASNGTGGNVAGASNSTLQISAPQSGVFARPVYSGQPVPQLVLMNPQAPQPQETQETATVPARPVHGMDRGIAWFQANRPLSQLLANRAPGKKAVRTLTNDDVNRENQSSGEVKFRGKTEQIK